MILVIKKLVFPPHAPSYSLEHAVLALHLSVPVAYMPHTYIHTQILKMQFIILMNIRADAVVAKLSATDEANCCGCANRLGKINIERDAGFRIAKTGSGFGTRSVHDSQ
jgi:hypothetical protein